MSSPRYLIYTDDDVDDLFLFEQATREISPLLRIQEFRDGAQTLAFLKTLSEPEEFPCVIILDMNMPGMNGKDTVKALKAHDVFSTIPVVIFTTSSSEVDRAFCEQYDVQCVIKPLHFGDLVETIRSLIGYCD